MGGPGGARHIGSLCDRNVRKVMTRFSLCSLSVQCCWARVQEVRDICAASPLRFKRDERSVGYVLLGDVIYPWSLYLPLPFQGRELHIAYGTSCLMGMFINPNWTISSSVIKSL